MEGYLRCGGIPGFDGEAKLVWLKEKKTKADGEAKLASLKEKTKTSHNEVRTYLVSLRDNKAKAHHADVPHIMPPRPLSPRARLFRFVLFCFVLFRSSAHRPAPVLAGVSAAVALRYVQASLAEAESLFKKGVALGDEGKWAEAVVSFSAAVAADLNHSGASCQLAFAEYKKAGEHCNASIEPYTRCLQHNPTNVTAHVNLAGVLRTVRRDVDEAERLLRRALELDPGCPYAHGLLSELLEQERGDLDGAITELESCLGCGGIPGWDGEANLVSLKEKKAKAHHAEVRTSIHPTTRVFCFVSFIHPSSCSGSCRCARCGASPICAGISHRS